MVLLVSVLVPWNPEQANGWEAWWLDTKEDHHDLKLLREWGFRDIDSKENTTRKLFHLRGSRNEVYNQAQDISGEALHRRGVVLIYDEYNHVCKNRIDAGPAVENVHKRGRGLDVGSIGGVQEPVLVPRYLFSQAIHRAIFGLEHLPDIKIARQLNPQYAQGWPQLTDKTVPDKHGFWLRTNPQGGDDNSWHYYSAVQEWYEKVRPSI